VEEVADVGSVFGEYIPLSSLLLEEYQQRRICRSLRPDWFPLLSWTTGPVAGRPVEGELYSRTKTLKVNKAD
jgi:hypothetical protein